MKKVFPLLLFGIICFSVSAQVKKKKAGSYNNRANKSNPFLHKQWWVGLKAGANLAKARVEKSYAVISPVDYTPAGIGKKYDNFKLLGKQIGLEATFYFRGFCLSVQPTYQQTRFSYSNRFEWTDNPDEQNSPYHVVLDYNQEQNLEHLVVPLLIKYELVGRKLSPYIQAGGFAGFLLDANKTVEVTGVDYASGGRNEFSYEPIIVGAKDLFAKTHYGIVGGAGCNYTVGNIRLNFDVQYKMALTHITSSKNRYSNDRLSGIGDAMDDLKQDNVSMSLGAMFPLRFLSSGFKSVDSKN
jgi:heat shock protein HspQ